MSSSDLHAIVGLGNPGAEYGRTRHNAGFWFVDGLAAGAGVPFRTESKFHGELARIGLGGRDVLLLKPGTFMNRSGQAVQALSAFYKIAPASILIAHDELDLPAGTVRLKAGGGHGGHNGLRDIHKVLGPDYLRLRIGIGHPGDKNLVLNYVLGRAGKNDEVAILDAFDDAGSAVETWLTRGWERALTQLHTKPVPPAGGAS